MKVSDYIVEYLINKDIKDVFGYPGGMVTHLMDSFRKKANEINSRLMYHEQALSFAACSYAQNTGKTAIVYATSGPGATNLLTGICNAYFDSIPVIFITGQVNTFESSKDMNVRQRGFQETDIVSIVKPITKKSIYVDDENKIKYYLDLAFYEANEGRKGPVLLDIPMNIFKAEIDIKSLLGYTGISLRKNEFNISFDFVKYKRPVLILGAGVKHCISKEKINELVKKTNMPVVTSMIAFDVLDKQSDYNFGFLGAYGHRSANFIVAKADLIISIGTRMDIRQVGANRLNFAPDAKIIRFDIDNGELDYNIHDDDICFNETSNDAINFLIKHVHFDKKWINTCRNIKKMLSGIDKTSIQEKIFDNLNKLFNEYDLFTTDVGQNQVWVAQYLENKKNNLVYFSGGHGSMGYSLPASIGLSYANPQKRIVSFNGDGGLQMNIQELQTIARDGLPIIIIVFNNEALGMIRHFQEMYFDGKYQGTTTSSGYVPPNFSNIANAYGIDSVRINDVSKLNKIELNIHKPQLIEIMIKEDTYVIPKLEFGKPNQDQEPLIDRSLYNKIMEL